jgi:hypothetical protein
VANNSYPHLAIGDRRPALGGFGILGRFLEALNRLLLRGTPRHCGQQGGGPNRFDKRPTLHVFFISAVPAGVAEKNPGEIEHTIPNLLSV